jgi:PAS domain S-box-containing protein
MDPEADFFERILDSLIVVDQEGKIKEVNQPTLRLLGYKREELIMLPMGKICKDFSLKALKDKIPLIDLELIYLNKEGQEIRVSVNITNGLSYPDEIIFMARDISKMRNLIDELLRSKKELEGSYIELRDSKDILVLTEKFAFTGRIATSIAHEIRNPLANVAMSVRQLKKILKLEDPKRRHMEIIERNIDRVNYLITELLNCARPAKLNPQAHDIHKVLESILESIKLKAGKIKVNKKFTVENSILNIDKEQMERALLNLVLNAIEAMPKGGNLTIITELNKNFFLIRIQDTGKGIPEKDIIRIFDPFFSTKPGGVGLGLTICYSIIVSHGGTIEVESKPKKGSIFTVSLPF